LSIRREEVAKEFAVIIEQDETSYYIADLRGAIPLMS